MAFFKNPNGMVDASSGCASRSVRREMGLRALRCVRDPSRFNTVCTYKKGYVFGVYVRGPTCVGYIHVSMDGCLVGLYSGLTYPIVWCSDLSVCLSVSIYWGMCVWDL